MYHVEVLSPMAHLWRFRGRMPSPADYARTAFQGLETCYLIVSRDSAEPLGIATVYSLDQRNRHAYVAVTAAPTTLHTGIALEGLVMCTAMAYRLWDLRRVYYETTAANLQLFGSGLERYTTTEARLAEYEFVDGRYIDKIYLSMSPDQCDRAMCTIGARAATGPLPGVVAVLQTVGLTLEALESHREERLHAVGIDSLALLELIVAAEEMRGGELPVEVVKNLQFVRDLLPLVSL